MISAIITAYLIIAGATILLGLFITLFLDGSSGHSASSETGRAKTEHTELTEEEVWDRSFWPFAQIAHKLGIKTWYERKKEFKNGKEPGWFDKINLWIERNDEK